MADAFVEFDGLAVDLVVNGTTDSGDGVEVLELDALAQRIVFVFADGDIDVAAELAFFHIGVRDVAVDEDLLEGLDEGERFFGGVDVGLGDDFHQRRSRAIEVDEGVLCQVGGFGDVFLEVDAVHLYDFAGAHDALLVVLGVVGVVERHAATDAEGEVHLGCLVVLGHVGVEVVLPIPLGDGGGATSEHESCEEGFFDSRLVQNGQCTRKAETGGAGIRIRLVAKGGGAGAEHFRVRLNLAVDLKSDGGNILHRAAFLCPKNGAQYDLFREKIP